MGITNPSSASTVWARLAQSKIAGADAASIDISGIGAGYSKFLLCVEGACDSAGGVNTTLQFNGAGTFDYQGLYCDGTSNTATSTGIAFFGQTTLQDTANIFISNDSGGSLRHSAVGITSGTNIATFAGATSDVTAEITQITLTLNSGAKFKIGTKYTLYGAI